MMNFAKIVIFFSVQLSMKLLYSRAFLLHNNFMLGYHIFIPVPDEMYFFGTKMSNEQISVVSELVGI